MKLRLLSAQDVRAALPMDAAITVMERAFAELSAGRVNLPQRVPVSTPLGTTLLMPAYLARSRELGLKVVSLYPDNPTRGLPAVTATVLVLDPETGRPLALLDGTELTSLRTGAAGGLAARILARPESRCVALFGAGVQARAQLWGLAAVRPVGELRLWNRTAERAHDLAREVASWPHPPPRITVVRSPAEAVRGADVILTATSSPAPLFDGHDLSPGAHITAVGSYTPDMRELDEVTLRRAHVVVDSRPACGEEAGELIQAGITPDAELGELVHGSAPGRRSPDEITLFKSVGVAVQDAAAAAAVLARAEELDLGYVFDLASGS